MDEKRSFIEEYEIKINLYGRLGCLGDILVNLEYLGQKPLGKIILYHLRFINLWSVKVMHHLVFPIFFIHYCSYNLLT